MQQFTIPVYEYCAGGLLDALVIVEYMHVYNMRCIILLR